MQVQAFPSLLILDFSHLLCLLQNVLTDLISDLVSWLALRSVLLLLEPVLELLEQLDMLHPIILEFEVFPYADLDGFILLRCAY